jgi:cyclomaltodextrinase
VVALNLSDGERRVDAGGASTVLAGAATVDGGRALVPARGWAVLG